MAVIFKKKNEYELLHILGGKELAATMKDSGISMVFTQNGVSLVNTATNVHQPVEMIATVAQFMAGGASKQLSTNQLNNFVTAYNLVSTPVEHKFTKGGLIPKVDGPSAFDALGDALKSIEEDTPKKIMASAPVPLKNATKIYQPVTATSAGSTYFVVAIAKDLLIAARLKGNKVSVRAEGDVTKYNQPLSEVGFDVHADYASFHVIADTPSLRYKVVGSAMFGLGIIFTKTANVLVVLEGAGI